MDEEQFQEINSLKYDRGFRPYEDYDGRKRCLVEHGISEEEAGQYVERFKLGGSEFITNFGPEKLLDALLALNLYTSDINLKRIRNRMEQEIDADLKNVPILLPNGERPLYTIYWMHSWAESTDHGEDDESFAALKLLGMSVDNMDRLDHQQYRVSLGTVLTLEMSDGRCHIVFPLGKIWIEGRTEPEPLEVETSDGSHLVALRFGNTGPNGRSVGPFLVMYVLDTREVWVAAPHSHYEEGMDEEDIKPRIERFPGMDEFMSLGVLSGFFTDNVSLQIKDRGYFYVRETMRFEGKIYAIGKEGAVDVA